MKTLLLVTSLSFILLLSGCASLFGNNNKTVRVNSNPEQAQVLMNNMPVGTTPLCVTVPSTWSPTLLTFKKRGYTDQCAMINTTFQPIGALNIFFWPAFIIDAVAGNTMKISPESRNICLSLSKA